MNDEDVARLAGIPPHIAYALRIVESGARPHPHAIRFEPRLWLKGGGPLVPFTPPLGTAAETNEDAFNRAMELDPTRAVLCTSFGAYQVMGTHLLAVTGKPAAKAVAAFRADPEGYSSALLVHWLKAHPKFIEAANKPEADYLALAMQYNGKASYAEKLEDAARMYLAQWPERG